MELTRSEQQFILDTLARLISRRYTDINIKFTLKEVEGQKASAQ